MWLSFLITSLPCDHTRMQPCTATLATLKKGLGHERALYDPLLGFDAQSSEIVVLRQDCILPSTSFPEIDTQDVHTDDKWAANPPRERS
jgi:hypothetical protein